VERGRRFSPVPLHKPVRAKWRKARKALAEITRPGIEIATGKYPRVAGRKRGAGLRSVHLPAKDALLATVLHEPREEPGVLADHLAHDLHDLGANVLGVQGGR